MDQETLAGTKKKIYQLLKITKYITDSPAKSYDCKFAVQEILRNKMPAENELGKGLKEVMEHYTIKGKFSKVREELVKQGISSIQVGEFGFEIGRSGEKIKTSVSGNKLNYLGSQ